MDERTHAWIAVRAVALLEDKGEAPNLVALLKPHVREASVGAWIPDKTDAKRGGARTENHILKIAPCGTDPGKRFVTNKVELLKHLGSDRQITGYLDKNPLLDAPWWEASYKGDVPRPGQHIPNRAMALSTMLKDLLLLGNETIDDLVPGPVAFLPDVASEARTQEDAAVLYFFMLSHFIADASMPCHCDARNLAGYDEGLHMELEKHWSKKVGTYFSKAKLLKGKPLPKADDVLTEARNVDGKFGLAFNGKTVPDLIEGHDVWLEMIYQCRASFALASIIAPFKSYPYDNSRPQAPFKDVLENDPALLAAVDRVALHDAVLNTAIVWKHVWTRVSKDP